ncbi:MAG TPA: GntR family transcriptional regulator [Terriglobia bacterium]|nr:GntR family transcriptional regulator [Terriglobia bacterium]
MRKLKIPDNLTARAYHSIKEHILDGQLDEDSRLTEGSLSSRLGISKSPIREALNRLEAEGLVRIEPRKGAYLRRLSASEMNELYELREALEVHVVRIAKVTSALLSELSRSIRRQRAFMKANDKAHSIEEDVHFHAELARSTDNGHLCTVLQNTQNQIWLCRRKTYDLSGSAAPDYHQSIVNALQNNDRAKAQETMREHIERVRRRLLQFMEEHHGRASW